MRVNDLDALINDLSTGIETIQAANNGISALTKLVESAQALVSHAQKNADGTMRGTLAHRFDALLSQIDQIAVSSGFNGINLLAGNDLTIAITADGTSSIAVSAFNDTAAGDLAIDSATNKWAASADISAASAQLTLALMTLWSQTQALSSSLSTMQIRLNFVKAMINALSNAVDNLSPTESNEEGTNLLALQTRQQKSTTALSLAMQVDQNVLRLFR